MNYLAGKSSPYAAVPRASFSNADPESFLSGSLTNEEFVQRFELNFHLLNQRERESLLVLADSMEVQAGVTILEAGDPSEQLFLIKSGSVVMMHEDYLAKSLSVGEVFGESAFVRGDKELFDYKTAEETVLLTIDYSFLAKMVRINPYFSRRLVASLEEHLAHKLDLIDAKLC